MKKRSIGSVGTGILGSILILFSFQSLWAYSPWTDNSQYEPALKKAKILRFSGIEEVDVYPIIQKNCIYEQLEDEPGNRTSDVYRQPHCASLRNQRIKASENNEMPSGTKLTRVPANQYFKVEMEISPQMSNRVGEAFGIQIIDAITHETMFLQGGWKAGDKRVSKAIRLKPGRYYWRCPVNPTPWYGLIAE
jgi:hypothetical protein